MPEEDKPDSKVVDSCAKLLATAASIAIGADGITRDGTGQLQTRI